MFSGNHIAKWCHVPFLSQRSQMLLHKAVNTQPFKKFHQKSHFNDAKQSQSATNKKPETEAVV
jgi:hypothetical protein